MSIKTQNPAYVKGMNWAQAHLAGILPEANPVDYSNTGRVSALIHRKGQLPRGESNCGKWLLEGHLKDGSGRGVKGYCHSWACPRCRPYLVEKWRGKLSTSDPICALTLHFTGEFEAAKRALDLLLKRLKLLRPGFQFLRITDCVSWHPAKSWRVTLFFKEEMVGADLVAPIWAELGGDPQVASRYLKSKLSQDQLLASALEGRNDLLPHHSRRVSMSRGFLEQVEAQLPEGEVVEDIEWRVLWVPLELRLAQLQEAGYKVERDGEDRYRFRPLTRAD